MTPRSPSLANLDRNSEEPSTGSQHCFFCLPKCGRHVGAFLNHQGHTAGPSRCGLERNRHRGCTGAVPLLFWTDAPIKPAGFAGGGSSYKSIETKRMNEKLPAPCEACRGSGLRHGSVCSECQGKGYRLFINGNQIPVRQEKPYRWQPNRAAQRSRNTAHRARSKSGPYK
jgi:hypothetical protein